MKPHIINKKTYFIAGWYIDKNVCTDLIKYFENSPHKKPGVLGVRGVSVVDKKRKLSTDLIIYTKNGDKEVLNYYTELNKVIEEYKKKYKYCSLNQNPWGIKEPWNIQKYKPKEGYFLKHCERTGGTALDLNRHLVFMTYLNDVKEGGETEFIHQKLKIKPETGLTLIWGADWTFTHGGIPSPTETKYISTGWYSYHQPK